VTVLTTQSVTYMILQLFERCSDICDQMMQHRVQCAMTVH